MDTSKVLRGVPVSGLYNIEIKARQCIGILIMTEDIKIDFRSRFKLALS